MKFFMCFTLFLTIACMMISKGYSSGGSGGGYEMKKMRKSSGRSAPQGFITIEMDQDSGNSGWGSGGGSGWGNNGWKEMPKMQMSIKINKKLDLGPMLAMLGSMGSSGWDDSSSEEDSWSSGGGSRGYGGGGSGGYGGGSSYGGQSSGWSSGGSNGYDGMSGYSSNRQYRRRKY